MSSAKLHTLHFHFLFKLHKQWHDDEEDAPPTMTAGGGGGGGGTTPPPTPVNISTVSFEDSMSGSANFGPSGVTGATSTGTHLPTIVETSVTKGVPKKFFKQ